MSLAAMTKSNSATKSRPTTRRLSQPRNARSVSQCTSSLFPLTVFQQRRHHASEYYDTADPFIDDSELAQDERTFFAQTKQKGFYVSSGQVALLNKYVSSSALYPPRTGHVRLVNHYMDIVSDLSHSSGP